MKRIGANYVQAGLWRGFAARDSNLVTGHRTSPPPRRPPNSLRRLVNDVHQPVASDAFRSTASRVNRRPDRWRVRTELSAEGRFGTKCGCCLVALTTAIK